MRHLFRSLLALLILTVCLPVSAHAAVPAAPKKPAKAEKPGPVSTVKGTAWNVVWRNPDGTDNKGQFVFTNEQMTCEPAGIKALTFTESMGAKKESVDFKASGVNPKGEAITITGTYVLKAKALKVSLRVKPKGDEEPFSMFITGKPAK